MKNITFEESFHSLKKYCENEEFKGWDPYDGLNSNFFQKLPYAKKSRFLRLAWIQFFKRLPFNLRGLVGIKKEHNPKGLALFLMGYCNLYKVNKEPKNLEKIKLLSDLILQKKSKNFTYACWGYNFDWQARAFFQPKYTPTVVATSFVTEALAEAYEITREKRLLGTIKNVEGFITEKLNKTFDSNGNFTLSYSPLDHTQVYNAGLLGVKTLCLIYKYTDNGELLKFSQKIVTYVCSKQKEDGAWPYSTLPYHQWIDSFHTGYNLECLYKYQETAKDYSFENNIKTGLNYYLNNFFTPEGIPKYYNNKTYPIDIHAPAQFMVTLCKMDCLKNNKVVAEKVFNWVIENMQDQKGFFYYQKKKNFTSKIPYMRWGQAWMFYAFSHYFINDKSSNFHG